MTESVSKKRPPLGPARAHHTLSSVRALRSASALLRARVDPPERLERRRIESGPRLRVVDRHKVASPSAEWADLGDNRPSHAVRRVSLAPRAVEDLNHCRCRTRRRSGSRRDSPAAASTRDTGSGRGSCDRAPCRRRPAGCHARPAHDRDQPAEMAGSVHPAPTVSTGSVGGTRRTNCVVPRGPTPGSRDGPAGQRCGRVGRRRGGAVRPPRRRPM